MNIQLAQVAALSAVALFIFCAGDAHAGYQYKCTSPDGKSQTFTNGYCPSGWKEEKLTPRLPTNEESLERARAEERAGTPCYAAKIGEYLPDKSPQGDPFIAPVKMNETKTRRGSSYQYVYEKYGRRECYIYLDSDLKVTAIQR